MATNWNTSIAESDDVHSSRESSVDGEVEDPDAVIYAEDKNDNAFIHLLIRTVERCLSLEGLLVERKSAKAKLLEAQNSLDDTMHEISQYDKCKEPALEDLLKEAKETQESLDERLLQSQAQFGLLQARVQEAAKLRARVLRELYATAGDFLYRSGTGELKSRIPSFRGRFNEGLAKLKYSANSLTHYAARARKYCARRLETVRDPSTDRATFRAAVAESRNRKAILDRKTRNQFDREQTFFGQVAYNLLCVAGVIAPPQSPEISLHSSDPSSRSPSSIRTDENENDDDDVEHDGSRSGLVVPKEEPEHSRLIEQRAKTAKARAELNRIKDEYSKDLAAFLVTYFPNIKKAHYDALYERSNGRSYEARLADAQEKLTQAEARLAVDWEEAVAAGVTDLPPSPNDLGGDSEDGRAASLDPLVIASKREKYEQNREPRVTRWMKRVAKSGSPANPDIAQPRTFKGKRKFPAWGDDIPDRDFDPGEPMSKRPKRRIERAKRSGKAMRARFEQQEEQRVRDARRRLQEEVDEQLNREQQLAELLEQEAEEELPGSEPESDLEEEPDPEPEEPSFWDRHCAMQ